MRSIVSYVSILTYLAQERITEKSDLVIKQKYCFSTVFGITNVIEILLIQTGETLFEGV
jgi:hypothetical protein